MIWSDLINRIVFLSLSGLGIIGNSLLLVKHIYSFIMGPGRKALELILMHLAFSNAIIACIAGVKDMAIALHIRNFAGDAGCKVMIYLERVARGLSICTTSLLSMTQAATVSPQTSWGRKFKPRTVRHILPYLLLFWIFNSLVSSNMLRWIRAFSSVNGSVAGMYDRYCYMLPHTHTVRWLFLSLMALRDVTFQGLMGWSSGSMAFRLYQHHKRVLYLRSSRPVSSTSPEIRATQSTLVLMTIFLVFYWADFIFSFYIGSTATHYSTALYAKIFIELGYATLSPFVLISRVLHAAKPESGVQHRRTEITSYPSFSMN